MHQDINPNTQEGVPDGVIAETTSSGRTRWTYPDGVTKEWSAGGELCTISVPMPPETQNAISRALAGLPFSREPIPEPGSQEAINEIFANLDNLATVRYIIGDTEEYFELSDRKAFSLFGINPPYKVKLTRYHRQTEIALASVEGFCDTLPISGRNFRMKGMPGWADNIIRVYNVYGWTRQGELHFISGQARYRLRILPNEDKTSKGD